ncbi:MAG: helix-turn-helix transcriptional regulator [Pelobacteraceae bacterium]|jgi:DNA-binding XRE family transcriptional regulator
MTKTIISLVNPEPQPLTDAETLGRFVRARRSQAGMGIHEAAAFCGVAVGTMTKIERASGDVRLSTVLNVCRMLGITISLEAKVN